MSEYTYVGQELDLFAHAVNWKAYFHARLAKYVRGDVLEIGAGIGGTTRTLCDGNQTSWLCAEPDAEMAGRLVEVARDEPFPVEPEVVVGGLADLDPERRFDAILYIDVLEHIEDDRGELEAASRFLKPGGKLVVLSPAFQFLFSPFDAAVGHHRRYTAKGLIGVMPAELEKVRVFYLDSVGMLTSLINRFVLKQGTPDIGQIQLWDRVIVRVSRVVDPVVGYSFGRSVIGVYGK
ncbi:MAG: SAM-dependent methyltransferase [Planctomycetota bacterium]|jgi:SAM-dependent methyltransferase